MIRALKGRNKLGFVDNSFVNSVNDEAKIHKCKRFNDVICFWLLGSISESIYASHVCSGIASIIWNEVFETYPKADGSDIFNLYKKINSLSKNGLSVSVYYSKLDALWKEFDGLIKVVECTCEASTQFNNNSKLMKLIISH